MSQPLVVGNWKMNGTVSQATRLAGTIVQGITQEKLNAALVLAPPATALAAVQERIAGSGISLAGQNCHWENNGAFTGEISPAMLSDLGCTYVIVGHSERRHIFNESDEIISRKLAAAIKNNLRPILCVGETLDQRNAGQTTEVIISQMQLALKELNGNVIANLEVAYEPVWAIGSGHNADSKQIAEVHVAIREYLTSSFDKASLRILYGGSVNPENANELGRITEVNGFLVGGASLKPETFLAIVRCFEQ
jgi:triosephosphate isomerase